jgi:hypothetical protein
MRCKGRDAGRHLTARLARSWTRATRPPRSVPRMDRTLACPNSLLSPPPPPAAMLSLHRNCEERNPRGTWEREECNFGMVSQVINLGSHGCRVAGLDGCQSSAGPGHGMEFPTKVTRRVSSFVQQKQQIETWQNVILRSCRRRHSSLSA